MVLSKILLCTDFFVGQHFYTIWHLVVLTSCRDSNGYLLICAPLVAALSSFCYERNFMMSHSDDKQADIIEAFNTTSRYLDEILKINNIYFDIIIRKICPAEL